MTLLIDIILGSPAWFKDVDSLDGSLSGHYQDYANGASYAVPECEITSDECIESNGHAVLARGVPPPLVFQVGTYPSTTTKISFTKDSIFIAIQPPSDLQYVGDIIDKVRIEWSTDKDFSHIFSEVIFGWQYQIKNLLMGKEYFVRVAGHNTAGYGLYSEIVPVKPMQSPDPPRRPILSLLPSSSYSAIEIGTSLHLEWEYPILSGQDLVGDGGDHIVSYMVEWSRVEWNKFSHGVWEIDILHANDDLSGSFRLLIESENLSGNMNGAHISANIPFNSTAASLKTTIENMPNIGEVDVVKYSAYNYTISFRNEVANYKNISIFENKIYNGNNENVMISSHNVVPSLVPKYSGYTNFVIEMSNFVSSKFLIPNLIPGQEYYVRIAAINSVGLGRKRETSPRFLAPPIQKPNKALSLIHSSGHPSLISKSSTSISVYIGPPNFNGGSEITQFLIEWDSQQTFDSKGDGSAVGKAYVDAIMASCSNCIKSFNISTNTFVYDGNESFTKQLVAQRIISVHFQDDEYSFQFKVEEANSSEIKVEPDHLRLESLTNMTASVVILGAKYDIVEIEADTRYYVRVACVNTFMGAGKYVSTNPASIIPLSPPKPPTKAILTVIDKTTLRVGLPETTSYHNSLVHSHVFELFRKSFKSSSSYSFFGSQETIEIDSTGLGIVGGSFAISLRNVTIKIPSLIELTSGESYIKTVEDLSPYISRGDNVIINGNQFDVSYSGEYSPSVIPLSRVYNGPSTVNVVISKVQKTYLIPFNASASELRNALEYLPHCGRIRASRQGSDSQGFKWKVTFLDNMGPQPEVLIDSHYLLGSNADEIKVTVLKRGMLPNDYREAVVRKELNLSHTFSNLTTGVNYYARIRSVNNFGISEPINAMPFSLSPGQVPDAPKAPYLFSTSATSVNVIYEEAAYGNGRTIQQYVIEIDTSPTFVNPNVLTEPVDHLIQRVSTNARSIPWNPSSFFTLSLGN